MLEKMKNLIVEEEGQALTEYGLLVGLIAVACIAALLLLGPKIAGLFEYITEKLPAKPTA